MFKIKVEEALLQHCLDQIEKYNFGQRTVANGNQEQQLTGIIGQSVMMHLFSQGYIDGKLGFDNGIDLVFNNKKIDVKTMGRTTEVRMSYTNNFLKLQDYFETEIYFFCSYNKNSKEVTFCGWISKADFITKRNFFPKGTIRKRFDGTTFTTFADLFEIDNIHLNQANTIDDLKKQLNEL